MGIERREIGLGGVESLGRGLVGVRSLSWGKTWELV